MRHFLVYAVIRLGLWAVIWWVLTLFDVGVMLAGVLAALIAMLISILFLNRLRDRAAMRWKDAHERRVEQRGEPVDEDADYEDSLWDDHDGVGAADEGDEVPSGAADPAELPDLSAHQEDAAEAQVPETRTSQAPGTEAAESGSAQTPRRRVRGSDR